MTLKVTSCAGSLISQEARGRALEDMFIGEAADVQTESQKHGSLLISVE